MEFKMAKPDRFLQTQSFNKFERSDQIFNTLSKTVKDGIHARKALKMFQLHQSQKKSVSGSKSDTSGSVGSNPQEISGDVRKALQEAAMVSIKNRTLQVCKPMTNINCNETIEGRTRKKNIPANKNLWECGSSGINKKNSSERTQKCIRVTEEKLQQLKNKLSKKAKASRLEDMSGDTTSTIMDTSKQASKKSINKKKNKEEKQKCLRFDSVEERIKSMETKLRKKAKALRAPIEEMSGDTTKFLDTLKQSPKKSSRKKNSRNKSSERKHKKSDNEREKGDTMQKVIRKILNKIKSVSHTSICLSSGLTDITQVAPKITPIKQGRGITTELLMDSPKTRPRFFSNVVSETDVTETLMTEEKSLKSTYSEQTLTLEKLELLEQMERTHMEQFMEDVLKTNSELSIVANLDTKITPAISVADVASSISDEEFELATEKLEDVSDNPPSTYQVNTPSTTKKACIKYNRQAQQALSVLNNEVSSALRESFCSIDDIKFRVFSTMEQINECDKLYQRLKNQQQQQLVSQSTPHLTESQHVIDSNCNDLLHALSFGLVQTQSENQLRLALSTPPENITSEMDVCVHEIDESPLCMPPLEYPVVNTKAKQALLKETILAKIVPIVQPIDHPCTSLKQQKVDIFNVPPCIPFNMTHTPRKLRQLQSQSKDILHTVRRQAPTYGYTSKRPSTPISKICKYSQRDLSPEIKMRLKEIAARLGLDDLPRSRAQPDLYNKLIKEFVATDSLVEFQRQMKHVNKIKETEAEAKELSEPKEVQETKKETKSNAKKSRVVEIVAEELYVPDRKINKIVATNLNSGTPKGKNSRLKPKCCQFLYREKKKKRYILHTKRIKKELEKKSSNTIQLSTKPSKNKHTEEKQYKYVDSLFFCSQNKKELKHGMDKHPVSVTRSARSVIMGSSSKSISTIDIAAQTQTDDSPNRAYHPQLNLQAITCKSGLDCFDILDEITLRDLKPLESEYPRKDHIGSEPYHKHAENTYLYKLVYGSTQQQFLQLLSIQKPSLECSTAGCQTCIKRTPELDQKRKANEEDLVDKSKKGDSYVGKTENANKKVDSYVGRTDSANKKVDSYVGRTDSANKKVDSYVGRSDSANKKVDIGKTDNVIKKPIVTTLNKELIPSKNNKQKKRSASLNAQREFTIKQTLFTDIVYGATQDQIVQLSGVQRPSLQCTTAESRKKILEADQKRKQTEDSIIDKSKKGDSYVGKSENIKKATNKELLTAKNNKLKKRSISLNGRAETLGKQTLNIDTKSQTKPKLKRTKKNQDVATRLLPYMFDPKMRYPTTITVMPVTVTTYANPNFVNRAKSAKAQGGDFAAAPQESKSDPKGTKSNKNPTKPTVNERKLWETKYAKSPSINLISYLEKQNSDSSKQIFGDICNPIPKNAFLASITKKTPQMFHAHTLRTHSQPAKAKQANKGPPISKTPRQEPQEPKIPKPTLEKDIQNVIEMIEGKIIDLVSSPEKLHGEAFNNVEKEIVDILNAMQTENSKPLTPINEDVKSDSEARTPPRKRISKNKLRSRTSTDLDKQAKTSTNSSLKRLSEIITPESLYSDLEQTSSNEEKFEITSSCAPVQTPRTILRQANTTQDVNVALELEKIEPEREKAKEIQTQTSDDFKDAPEVTMDVPEVPIDVKDVPEVTNIVKESQPTIIIVNASEMVNIDNNLESKSIQTVFEINPLQKSNTSKLGLISETSKFKLEEIFDPPEKEPSNKTLENMPPTTKNDKTEQKDHTSELIPLEPEIKSDEFLTPFMHALKKYREDEHKSSYNILEFLDTLTSISEDPIRVFSKTLTGCRVSTVHYKQKFKVAHLFHEPETFYPIFLWEPVLMFPDSAKMLYGSESITKELEHARNLFSSLNLTKLIGYGDIQTKIVPKNINLLCGHAKEIFPCMFEERRPLKAICGSAMISNAESKAVKSILATYNDDDHGLFLNTVYGMLFTVMFLTLSFNYTCS